MHEAEANAPAIDAAIYAAMTAAGAPPAWAQNAADEVKMVIDHFARITRRSLPSPRLSRSRTLARQEPRWRTSAARARPISATAAVTRAVPAVGTVTASGDRTGRPSGRRDQGADVLPRQRTPGQRRRDPQVRPPPRPVPLRRRPRHRGRTGDPGWQPHRAGAGSRRAHGSARARSSAAPTTKHGVSTSRTTASASCPARTAPGTTMTPWSSCCPTWTATTTAPAGPRKTSRR